MSTVSCVLLQHALLIRFPEFHWLLPNIAFQFVSLENHGALCPTCKHVSFRFLTRCQGQIPSRYSVTGSRDQWFRMTNRICLNRLCTLLCPLTIPVRMNTQSLSQNNPEIWFRTRRLPNREMCVRKPNWFVLRKRMESAQTFSGRYRKSGLSTGDRNHKIWEQWAQGNYIRIVPMKYGEQLSLNWKCLQMYFLLVDHSSAVLCACDICREQYLTLTVLPTGTFIFSSSFLMAKRCPCAISISNRNIFWIGAFVEFDLSH